MQFLYNFFTLLMKGNPYFRSLSVSEAVCAANLLQKLCSVWGVHKYEAPNTRMNLLSQWNLGCSTEGKRERSVYHWEVDTLLLNLQLFLGCQEGLFFFYAVPLLMFTNKAFKILSPVKSGAKLLLISERQGFTQ